MLTELMCVVKGEEISARPVGRFPWTAVQPPQPVRSSGYVDRSPET